MSLSIDTTFDSGLNKMFYAKETDYLEVILDGIHAEKRSDWRFKSTNLQYF